MTEELTGEDESSSYSPESIVNYEPKDVQVTELGEFTLVHKTDQTKNLFVAIRIDHANHPQWHGLPEALEIQVNRFEE